jgi:hypothetical protein
VHLNAELGTASFLKKRPISLLERRLTAELAPAGTLPGYSPVEYAPDRVVALDAVTADQIVEEASWEI